MEPPPLAGAACLLSGSVEVEIASTLTTICSCIQSEGIQILAYITAVILLQEPNCMHDLSVHKTHGACETLLALREREPWLDLLSSCGWRIGGGGGDSGWREQGGCDQSSGRATAGHPAL